MNSLFVYGTLRHVPLLAVVVGRPADSLDLREAVLPDHQVHEVLGHDFPFLKATGTGATGILIGGLSDVEIERLRYYEGGFDYDLTDVSVLADQKNHGNTGVYVRISIVENRRCLAAAGLGASQRGRQQCIAPKKK